MKKKIMNNLDLKLLALLFSIILWLIVVNIDDPVKSVQFSGVEVKILNAGELENKGKVYEVIEDTGVVTVTVKGRRSIVEDISKENISAVADMRNLSSMNTLSIVVSSNKYANELDDIKCDTDNVKLNIEDLKKVQKGIFVEVLGEPAEEYILGNLTANLNQIYLEGPASHVDKVASVKAQLQVEGVTNNVSSSIPIRLYDADGELIDDSRITMNINEVSVTQEILFTKTVPVQYSVSGTPEAGYAATGEISANVNAIEIAGKKSQIDGISVIQIPATTLNIDGVTADYKAEISLDKYLPNGVILANPTFDGKATVIVEVEKETFITATYSKDDVRFANLPEGRSAEVIVDGNYITNDERDIRIYGLSTILDNVDIDNITIRLDFAAYMRENGMTELTPGIHYLSPEFRIPSGAYVKEDFKVQIRIQ